jgi:uroporphyrinogen-III decarboxylase
LIYPDEVPRLAILGDCGSATLAFHVSLRGMENALLDLIEQPKLVHSVMEKGVAIAVEKGKFNIDLGIRILRLNDSVANMSVISPKHWRTFVFPHMKEVCTELHRYPPDAKRENVGALRIASEQYGIYENGKLAFLTEHEALS